MKKMTDRMKSWRKEVGRDIEKEMNERRIKDVGKRPKDREERIEGKKKRL